MVNKIIMVITSLNQGNSTMALPILPDGIIPTFFSSPLLPAP
jgi:hypothetical protein